MAVLGSTSLTGCTKIPNFLPGGTIWKFQQTSAPSSWTKLTTHNNKALRVVTATAGSGGSTAFSSVLASRTPSGNVSGSNQGGGVAQHTLSWGQMPSHSHAYASPQVGNFRGQDIDNTGNSCEYTSNDGFSNRGSNQQHAHGFQAPGWTGSYQGSAMDFAVQFVDVIFAQKDT